MAFELWVKFVFPGFEFYDQGFAKVRVIDPVDEFQPVFLGWCYFGLKG